MRSLFKVFGVLVVLLLIAMVVLPYVLKDEITEVVKNATNNNLNAKVDFEDVDLSLFRSFPSLNVSIDNLSIISNSPFEGDTLFSAQSFRTSINLISLIKGDVIKVKSITLDSPQIMIYTLKDGRANYNITKNDSVKDEAVQNVAESDAKFNIELESYNIINGRIAFIDQTSNMLVAVNNLNHEGNGDFSQDDFVLDTETEIDELTFEMDGIKYLNKVKTSLGMSLGMNIPNMIFTLKENELSINNLSLNFDGSIAMPEEDIDIDLKFKSPRAEFKDIISLIPAIYKNEFDDIKSSGSMELAGHVKGVYSENRLPSFNIDLKVADGNFKYPDLPTPVNNVILELNVTNKDGIIDHTIVNLSKIHLELGSEPIDGNLYMTNPESGPNIETKLKGKVDLANIKTAFDLKDIEKLEGIILSDFELKGNISSTNKNYEDLNAKGNLSISNLVYQSNNFNQNVNISDARLNFTPQNVQLSNFEAKIGENDIKVNGSLNNLISYVLSDGILVGNLNLSSNYFDFNPYLTSEESIEEAGNSSETEVAAFDIPKNINFRMKSKFNKLLYDNLELTNVSGQIIVKDSKVTLENLQMNLLKGSLSGNGYYAKSEFQENPDIQFNLDVKEFNIKEAYDKFISIKQFAPMAKYIQGNFSSNLKLTTSLDNTLTPVWETFFSNGLLNLKSAEIKNFKPFTTVGSLLNLQELSNPKFNNVNPKFEIKNGRFYLSPMKYKVGNYNVVLSGSSGIDQSLNYVMEIDVPAEKVKNQANKAIGSLLGKDVNLLTSKSVKVKALIGGTIDSPSVKTSAGSIVEDVASGVVEQVKTQIVDEAKAKADSLKLAAEKKLKEEAKKKEAELKKKLEEEAKKKLKNIFKFG
jgi:AsmA-like C-terminal region/AsmA family